MLSFIGLSAGAVLLLGILQTGLIKPYYRNSKIKTIQVLADQVIDDLLGEDGSDTSHIEDAFASTVDNNACVVLYNSEGRRIYRADQLGEGCVFNDGVSVSSASDYHSFASLKAFVEDNGGEYSADVTNQETSQNMLVYGKKLKENLGTYYLFMNTPLEPVDSLITAFSRQYISLMLIIIAVAGVFSIWLSGKIVRPITNMQKEAVRLSKADYDVQFDGGSFTETKDLAGALNNAASQLGQIEEMRRSLMANLSHDIRTPLTNIRAYAEMIRDISGNDPDRREKHLNVIIRETEYMNRLITDMSELSQMQTGSYVLWCLPGIELEHHCCGDPPHALHLLGEAVRAHEVRRLAHRFRDKGASAVLPGDQPLALELRKGQAHGRAREAVRLAELSLGGKHVAGTHLVLNLLVEKVDELVVERLLSRDGGHVVTVLKKARARVSVPAPPVALKPVARLRRQAGIRGGGPPRVRDHCRA